MTQRDLHGTATGCTNLISVSTEASYSAITAGATIECESTTLDLSDAISLDIGYSDSHGVVFSGYVKRIEYTRPDGIIRITANDLLVRAVDYFIASDNPEAPLQYNATSDYDLINGLLSQAGIGPVVSGAPSPSFTFGNNEDGARFNLQSVSDAVQFVCSVTGRVCYVESGDIYYVDRKPYWVSGDTVSHTINPSAHNVIDISYEKSNASIRNVVKVYGKTPITAKASASSPYLVVDQTSVIAHELIDLPELAQAVADVNLSLMNRLQSIYTITLEGDHTIVPREIVQITESFTGASSELAFAYRVAHQWDAEGGFITSLTANA